MAEKFEGGGSRRIMGRSFRGILCHDCFEFLLKLVIDLVKQGDEGGQKSDGAGLVTPIRTHPLSP